MTSWDDRAELGSEDGPRWLDEWTVQVDDVTCWVTEQGGASAQPVGKSQQWLLTKDPSYLRRATADYRRLGVRRMVEAGIWGGGSVAYWNRVLRPVTQLAFDLYDRQIEPLEGFSANTPGLTIRYGLDQGDGAALRAAVAEVFDGEPIDLVIDDASHLYEPSRVMFETLFPLLRPGGLYVIEDWAWSHNPSFDEQVDYGGYFAGRAGLSNLVAELVIAAGSRDGLIESVLVESSSTSVVRRDSETSEFRLADWVSVRGAPFAPRW